MKKNLTKTLDIEFYTYCKYTTFDSHHDISKIISFLFNSNEITGKEYKFLLNAISAVWCEKDGLISRKKVINYINAIQLELNREHPAQSAMAKIESFVKGIPNA